jgi:tetratricopeptide (TPR) repeat protein
VVGEVVLSMLSRRDRVARHLAAAEYFEATNDEELTGVVAAQYESAHNAAPEDERARLAITAADWLHRAGSRALSLGSPEQALEFYERAIDLTPPGAKRGELLESSGDAADATGNWLRASELFQSALQEYNALRDRDGVGRANAGLATVLTHQRRYADALAIAEAAYLELGDTGAVLVRTRLANLIAMSYSHGLDLHKSLEWAEVALELSENINDLEQFSTAGYSRAVALFSLGRHYEATMLQRGLVLLAESVGLIRDQARSLMALSISTMADDPRSSLRSLWTAVELAERIGARQVGYTAMENYAELCVGIGDWDDAQEKLDALPEEFDHEYLAATKAMLSALKGDFDAASAWLRTAPLEDPGTAEFAQGVATQLQSSAFIHLAMGDLVRAFQDAQRSIQVDPRGLNVDIGVGIAGRAALWMLDVDGARWALDAGQHTRGRRFAATLESLIAGIAALEGRLDEAVARYASTRVVLLELELEHDMALMALDQLILLGPQHAVGVDEAAANFTRIGARPYLERLVAVRGTAEGSTPQIPS